MKYYKEMTADEACDHDVYIALEQLQASQEVTFGVAPGLFMEEISERSGWGIYQVRASIKRGIAAKVLESVPLVYTGSTGKSSYRIIRG